MQGNVLGSRAGRRLSVLLAVALAAVTAMVMFVAPARAMATEQYTTLPELPVTFNVVGQPKGDVEFSATLNAVSDDAPMPAAGGEVATRTGAGEASFGQIEFTKPGVWDYEVTQTTTTDNSHWTLDTTKYYVEIVAEWQKDEQGAEKFVAYALAYTDPANPGDKHAKLAFSNTYTADGKWEVDPGQKWYENGELKAGDFSFDIYRKNGDDWVWVAETTNGAGVEQTEEGHEYSVGSWAFEALDLTEPGTFQYKVMERLPEGATSANSFKVDGITYDSSVYYYDVTVEAVENEYQATEVECTDAKGAKVEKTTFTNVKDPAQPKATPAKPKPSQPTVAGKPLAKTGDASWGLAVFSGILLAAGAAFVVVSLVLRRRNA